jgi:hypothetical protein
MSWQISSIWRHLRRSRLSMVSLVFLTLLMLVALLADLIASDLPILLRLKGETHVLPAVFRPAALRQFDNQQLRQLLDSDPQAGSSSSRRSCGPPPHRRMVPTGSVPMIAVGICLPD